MELGNLFFNPNKNQQYDCPDYVVALLQNINSNLTRIMNNKDECKYGYESPFDNSGNSFECEVFTVEAYNWNDKKSQDYNFKCGDIEISWYKYLGRDTTINKEISEKEAIDMFNKCNAALRKLDLEVINKIEATEEDEEEENI